MLGMQRFEKELLSLRSEPGGRRAAQLEPTSLEFRVDEEKADVMRRPLSARLAQSR
jgi:hypothetical protein